MTQSEIVELAREFGFAEVGFCSTEPFLEWRRTLPNAHKTALANDNDPLELAPWAKSLMICAYPYSFYKPYEGARICAYYVAIQESRIAGRKLAQALNERGVRAQVDLSLPHKSAANRAGIGRYGRNGIMQTPEHGSRVSLRLLAIDQECEYGTPITDSASGRDCGNCHLCEQNCPTKAIKDGYLDPSKCLRGLMLQGPAVPLAYREKMGDRMLGCEVCLRSCPHNHGEMLDPPDALIALGDVARMINPDTRDDYLAEYGALLGPNYAIPNRVLSQAILVAANMNRTDLLPYIEPLRESQSEAVREHAIWAVEKLNGRETPLGAVQQRTSGLRDRLRRNGL